MFQKLTEHIYIRPFERYTDRPNIGLICGTKKALLFDAGNSAAHVSSIQQDLLDAGLPYPNYVALSHFHWDHSFGACAWKNAPIIAGRDTNDQLRAMQSWEWDDISIQKRLDNRTDIAFCTEMIKREYPDRSQIRVATADIIFDGSLSLDLGGGVACRLIHARGPHSEDSVICYIPSDKFVFLSDSANKDLHSLPWHFDIAHEENFFSAVAELPYDSNRVKAYLDLLNALDFTHCIGGHSDNKTRKEIYNIFTK